MAFLSKCAMYSWASVGSSARAVQSLDGQNQESILIKLFREASSPPGIETRRGDAEFPAHPANRELSILLMNGFKFYRLRAAKYAAVFFRNRFSISDSRRAFRSRLSSSRSGEVALPPGLSPASTRVYHTHPARRLGARSWFLATSLQLRPPSMTSLTASARNYRANCLFALAMMDPSIRFRV